MEGYTTVPEVMVGQSQKSLKEMLRRTNNAKTVPQIFLGDEHLGGLDELTKAYMYSNLDAFKV